MPDHLETTKKAFGEVADLQEGKGIIKYGKPLDPLDNYDWLDMEAEELVDAFKYNRAEKEKRNFAVNKIRRLLEDNFYDSEIDHWLDELEGGQ